MVTILPGTLDHIIMDPSEVEVVVGETQTFSAAGFDQYDNIVKITPVWGSTAGTMLGNTLIAQTTPTKGIVTASNQGINGFTNVTVTLDKLHHIVVNPTYIEVTVSVSQVFTAIGYDYYNNILDIELTTFEWSANVGVMIDNTL